jgi:hypothetical protein
MQRTQVLHQRISKLIESLIALEQKNLGGSKADALERLIIKASSSGAALELIAEEAGKDPAFGPLFKRLTEHTELKQRHKSRS